MRNPYQNDFLVRRLPFSGFLSRLVAVALTGGVLLTANCASPPDKSGVKPSAISLPSGAGSIEGLGESFEPQLNTGGSSYGVSISVPPGRAGLAPSIRLGYNSFSGNGIAGIGWSLEFMSVKRQTDKGFPEYDAGDTFVFGGEELVPLNNVGQDWRCENERSFQRLRQIDSNGDGLPDAWEVTEANGTKHTLGRFRGQGNRWSVVVHPDKAGLAPFDRTYSWMLDSTTDLSGNRIEYEYLLRSGVLYPSRITYSHLSNNFHEVTFQYQNRPDAFDDYRPSFSARMDQRLARIEVRSQGQLVRAYNFVYDYAAGDLLPAEAALQSTYLDLGITLLKRVVQVDRSGNDLNYLPPLVFTYSGLDLTKAEQRSFTSPPELDLANPDGRVQLVDLDGDSLPDLFATTLEGATTVQRAALNRGETRVSGEQSLAFAAAKIVIGSTPIDLAAPNTIVHDPNGKGLVDLSALEDDGGNKRLDTFLNRARLESVDENTLGFSPENIESTVLANPPAFVTYSGAATRQMDVNFDKKGDFVNLETGFGAMTVNTFYLDRSGNWVSGQSTLPSSYPLVNTFQDPNGNPNALVHLADMNGDRLLDLVCLAPTPSGGGQRVHVSYWPLVGRGRYGEELTITNTGLYTFDIGTTDLRDLFVEDITGDGLADILYLDGSGPETVLSLRVNVAGQRWSPPYTRGGLPRYAPRDPANPTVLRLADLNGNGSTDILFRNTSPDQWLYFELLPQGAPSLMVGIDNGLGLRTAIVYGSAAEDEQLARESGHPWRTFAPIALQVVRQIRVSCGVDLNGDGKEDTKVMGFRYRDPYYDGFEREFRGFAFAQRVDYGDDFLFNPVSGLMQVSTGWNTTQTPTGQKSGPSLVSRYRFYTGAADQRDNDDYGGPPPPDRKIDEITDAAGREEEPLKGLQLVEEQVDPVVLHSASDGGFDLGCEAALEAITPEGQAALTPNAYVYTRTRQEWTMRRLYRPAEALPYIADQDANGFYEDYRNSPVPPVPQGRFIDDGIAVLPENGRSVSFVFVSSRVTEAHAANGLLSAALGYPSAAPQRSTVFFDDDDYGNQTYMLETGLEDSGFDDERLTTTSFALGGNALALWVIDKPDVISVTDENGAFVSKNVFFYDGTPFVGVQGQIQNRALLHRTTEYIDASRSVQAGRSGFDAYGNLTETRDPVGNIRRMTYDPAFRTYPVTETMVVGGGSADLVVEAEYDYGFGIITRSKDLNGVFTSYRYDSFGRLVATIQPGDTEALPTRVYEYQAADPVRGRALVYDAAGNLSVVIVPVGTASRVITRQREAGGQPGQYVTASYSDGSGKDLATIGEGTFPGTWVVKEATSFNLRGTPQMNWLPFQISSAELPQFTLIWPSGRPPQTDGVNPAIVSTDFFYDPLGREIRSAAPPETWGGVRREKANQILPFKQVRYDEEDLRSGSPHFGTPHIEISDGLGRLVAVEEVVKLTDSGQPGPMTSWKTEYAYDLNDRIIRIRDSQGNVKAMEYDGLKRMLSVNDPDQGKRTFTYDDAANIREILDNKGQKTVYTYDGVNRLKTEDYQDGGPRIYDVEYFYDAPQAAVDLGDGTSHTATYTKGQIAFVRDQSGETHFSYDVRTRLQLETKRIPDPVHGKLISYTTKYEYDSADRIRTLTYPDGDVITNSYNSRNLLERITGVPSVPIVTSIAYRPSAQIENLFFGNGVVSSYAYDPRLRLTGLRTENALNTRFIDNEYSFDGVSNVQVIEDKRDLLGKPEGAQRFNHQIFGYDNLYRLNRVEYPGPGGTPAGVVSYSYDRISNLLSQTSDISHVDQGFPVVNLGTLDYGGSAGRTNRSVRLPADPPGPHALSLITAAGGGVDSRAYAYDANGNMLNVGSVQCTWDFKDRLVAAESEKNRAEYTYDYMDRRITKRVLHKASSTNGATQVVSLYINKYFEVRDREQPTKYVYNQETRLARVTGSLSNARRIQRLRLDAGWNLRSLAVSSPDMFQQLTSSALMQGQPVFVWNSPDRTWLQATADEPLSAGAVLWVHATSNGTVTLMGDYADPTNLTVASGSSFYPGAGLESWDLGTWFGAHPTLSPWQHDSAMQNWTPQIRDFSNSSIAPSSVISPGAAFFAQSPTPVMIEPPDSTLRIRYYHPDHIGSSSIVTDATGALVEETAFYPFGEPRFEYQPRGSSEFYKFSQKERDRETGLHYFSARYLAGNLSRFISVDPKYAAAGFLTDEELSVFLREPQDLNLYAYARNNPVKYTDPTGLGVFSDIYDFVSDNLWIPGYNELDKGRTLRVGIAVVETVGGAASCLETIGVGCAVAANGLDDLQAEFTDGRTYKAAAVTKVTGSETAGKAVDIGISIFLGGASAYSKASKVDKVMDIAKEVPGAKAIIPGTRSMGKAADTIAGVTGAKATETIKFISTLGDEAGPRSSSRSSGPSSTMNGPRVQEVFSLKEENACYGENQ